MILSSLFNFSNVNNINIELNVVGIIVLPLIILTATLWKKIKKKKISPILLIVISAILGIIIGPIFD
jgi:uncharacterized membrane protein